MALPATTFMRGFVSISFGCKEPSDQASGGGSEGRELGRAIPCIRTFRIHSREALCRCRDLRTGVLLINLGAFANNNA
jgi:hypothetical protein